MRTTVGLVMLVTLANRSDGPRCEARLALPINE